MLVRGMTELLERALGPSVTMETRFPLGLQWVTADPNHLEMALLNLAVNARDAMPDGGSIIFAARPETVSSAETGVKPASYVCLSVIDAGEGMDEATLARAGEPFFTTKGIGKGTGLGLPMVQGFAEQSGGRFRPEKPQRQGDDSRALASGGAQISQVAAVTEDKPSSPVLPRPLTVLVVDDDSLVLTNMAAMLDDIGHRVFEAASARRALCILRREEDIDLVITDQAMPRMTGIELIAAINSEWPDLPTILATGYAELPPETNPLQPRLAKPFRQHDLVQAVEQATKRELTMPR